MEQDGQLELVDKRQESDELRPNELERTNFNCFGGFGGFGFNFRLGLRLQRSVSYDDRRRRSRESSPPSPPYTPSRVSEPNSKSDSDALSCRCKECARFEKREEPTKTNNTIEQSNQPRKQRRRRSASVGGDEAETKPLRGNFTSLDSVRITTNNQQDIQEWWKKRRKLIRKRRNKIKAIVTKVKKNKTTEDTDFVADGILTDRYPDEDASLWWSIREDVRLPN